MKCNHNNGVSSRFVTNLKSKTSPNPNPNSNPNPNPNANPINVYNIRKNERHNESHNAAPVE